jgi:hypothetical protein
MSVDHVSIRDALEAGEPQKKIAARLGCSPATVNKIAKANGVHPSSPQRSPGVAAAADYALERRILLLNKLFDKVSEMVEGPLTPNGLQALTIAMGILTDKRRLEDGEVTARTEVSGGDARERIASRLDELAARRRTTDAA